MRPYGALHRCICFAVMCHDMPVLPPLTLRRGEKEGKMKEYLCNYCGKVISGEHAMIKTQRGTELHICKECIEKEVQKKEVTEKGR